MKSKIAVCITEHNRPEVFKNSIYHHGVHRPDNSMLFVVDDASDKPVRIGGNFYRFNENVGVAKSKNKCLELAYNAGAEHIFLFDSDCYPLKDGWHVPYIENKEPHLLYQFKIPGNPACDMRELYRDDEIIAYSHTRGAMLYIHRSVLDVVGGMDTAYGKGMYEHADWTNRIHNAGLTTHRAMDVVGSDKLIYCLDQDVGVESSIPPEVRRRNLRANRGLYQKSKTSKEYKDYK